MARQIILLWLALIIVAANASDSVKNERCNDFHANFNLKKVIGSWYVVAIIPEKMFPDYQEQVTCYRVEFSETDVAGLRWLINKTIDRPPRKDFADHIKGTIVRQRYHSVPPFDVWSKSVEGVNGCFQQVLSLDTDKSDITRRGICSLSYGRSSMAHKSFFCEDKALVTHEALMQLHLYETTDGSGPFLLQMLWGKMISVVIYKRTQGVTIEQLKPISELVTRLRGPQLKPKICDRSLKDLLGLRHS